MFNKCIKKEKGKLVLFSYLYKVGTEHSKPINVGAHSEIWRKIIIYQF